MCNLYKVSLPLGCDTSFCLAGPALEPVLLRSTPKRPWPLRRISKNTVTNASSHKYMSISIVSNTCTQHTARALVRPRRRMLHRLSIRNHSRFPGSTAVSTTQAPAGARPLLHCSAAAPASARRPRPSLHSRTLSCSSRYAASPAQPRARGARPPPRAVDAGPDVDCCTAPPLAPDVPLASLDSQAGRLAPCSPHDWM